jgi:hypothetical protein
LPSIKTAEHRDDELQSEAGKLTWRRSTRPFCHAESDRSIESQEFEELEVRDSPFVVGRSSHG